MTGAGEKRWDRDPFADRPPIGPDAELYVCRVKPAELSGKLDKLDIGGKGIHPLEALGLAYGGNPATYSLSLRDRVGRGKQQTFFALGNVTVRDFGEPKIPMELPAAEEPKVTTAPAPPKERSSMESPPMVQMPLEALAAAAQSGDRMLLQMLAPLLTQAINAQGPEFQRRVLEALTRIDERQVRLDERLTRLEAQQADEGARSARNEELLGRLAKELEGTPITSVEQGKALIQRLGPEVFGLGGGEPEERVSRWMELLGPVLAQLGPAVAPMLAALAAKMAAALSGGVSLPAAIAVAAEEPAEPEPEPELPAAPPPRAPPRRAPAPATFRPPAPATFRPPGVTTGHAGPGPADTGT